MFSWIKRLFGKKTKTDKPRMITPTGVVHNLDTGALFVSWTPWPTGLYAEGKSLNVGDDLLVLCKSGIIRRFRVTKCECIAGPMSDLLYGPRAFQAKVEYVEEGD